MADLVTDAPPPDTITAARTAGPAAARARGPRAIVGVIASVVLASFAVVGAMTAGSAVSEVMNGVRAGSSTADATDVTAECRMGEPQVEVVRDGLADAAPRGQISFCMGVQPETRDPGTRGITCLVSESSVPPSRESVTTDILGACVVIERVAAMEAEIRRADRRAEEGPMPMVSLRSWDDAEASATWPVHRPAWIPEGYSLAALQRNDSPDTAGIDSVVAIYLRNGMPLTIEQSPIGDAGAFRVDLSVTAGEVGDVATGHTTVNGQPALWVSSVASDSVIGGAPGSGTVTLTWSDGTVGYRLSARAVDLGDLRRVGISLGEE